MDYFLKGCYVRENMYICGHPNGNHQIINYSSNSTPMQCPQCNTPNEENARFCMNCGYDLHAAPPYRQHPQGAASSSFSPSVSDHKAGVYIVIFLACHLFLGLVRTLLNMILPHALLLNPILQFFYLPLWLLLPLAVKDKVLRLVVFVLAAIMIIWGLVGDITYLMQMMNIQQ